MTTEKDTEIVWYCQRLAQLCIGNRKLPEVKKFLESCMIDEAMAQSNTKIAAARLVGMTQKHLFRKRENGNRF